MQKKTVLMPLPDRDFDPTEAALSWKIIRDSGHDVVFATESGERACCDPLMMSGEGLDVWGFVPLLKKLKVVGLVLRASKAARAAYKELEQDAAFQTPLRFDALEVDDFDGLILPGGHAPGMRQYLESASLQGFIVRFFEDTSAGGTHKPVGAVCHGVLAVARSISKATGRSVLHGRKTTALTWSQESKAALVGKLCRFWDPGYYRTYSESGDEPRGYWSVESEVKRLLADEDDFLTVPESAPNYFHKTNDMARDTPQDSRPAWVVRDGNYVSARWPGDVCTFAKTFVALLDGETSPPRTDALAGSRGNNEAKSSG